MLMFNKFQKVTDYLLQHLQKLFEPFGKFPMIIEYRMQFDGICMRCSITLCQFAKRTQIACGVVAKGNWLPFRPLCLQ